MTASSSEAIWSRPTSGSRSRTSRSKGRKARQSPGSARLTRLPESKLLLFQSASNVTIKNITFDGANKTQALVLFFAHCPGTRLENCRLIDWRSTACWCPTVRGPTKPGSSSTALKFQTEAGRTAIHFMINPSAKAIMKNRHFDLRKCEFIGLGERITAENIENLDTATIALPAGETVKVVPKSK